MTTDMLSRRKFVVLSAGAGAALMLGIRTLDASAQEAPDRWNARDDEDGGFEPNLWLTIDGAGTVTIRSAKSEMGQGVWTALPMVVAEELDADWSKVRVERAPTNGKYQTSTGGSGSVRSSYTPLRVAGATARAMLVAAAAQQWSVAASECRTSNGVVTHPASKRSALYGDLAAAASKMPVPAQDQVKLKDPSEFKMVGKVTPRLDLPSKVNGTAQFGIDVRVPNMLIAVAARCPELGATLKSVNDAKAKAIPGVQQVISFEAVEHLLPARVVVFATDTWSAMRGRDALQIEWAPGPNANYSSAGASATYHAQLNGDAVVTATAGTPRAAATGETLLEAVYEFPLLAHAPMEPMNCTADVRADGVDIWAPTQAPDGMRTAVARFLNVPPDSVNVHVTMLGGGFGRRSKEDFGVEAVQLSKAAGRPVKVIWTREEDIQHDFYRVDGIQRMRAVMDAQGNIVTWEDRVVGPSTEAYANPASQRHNDQAARPPYNIPNYKLEFTLVPSPVPMWFWRAVSNTQNGYCMEAFLDEVARAAGKDSVAYRLALLEGQPRPQHVVQLAAEKSGWGTPLPARHGRGIAFYNYDGSPTRPGTMVAHVIEVQVSDAGEVKVNRVTSAIDCGQMVNPDTVMAQVEGSVGWALSAALYGEITVKNGRIEQSNFNNYRVVRMNEMPPVDVHLVENHEVPTGVGEPAVPGIAPALLNAIYSATGVRVRKLPIRAELLRAGAGAASSSTGG